MNTINVTKQKCTGQGWCHKAVWDASLPFLCSYEGHVTEVETARELVFLPLTHGLFLLAGDGVSNSISQVFIHYFPFQSWVFCFFFFLTSPIHLHTEKKKCYKFCNFHLWQPSLSYCSLITKYWRRFL